MSAARAIGGHAWIRLRVTARTPATVGFALFIASQMFYCFEPFGSLYEGDMAWMARMALPLIGMYLAMVARAAVRGRTATASVPHGFFVEACPALPVGLRQRNAAEGLAALALLGMIAVILMPLTVILDITVAFPTTTIGICVLIPWVFLGGYTASAVHGTRAGTPIAITAVALYAIQEVAIQLRWVLEPTQLLAMTCLLTAAIIGSTGIKLSPGRVRRRPTSIDTPLHREPRTGHRQLWLDQLLRPLPLIAGIGIAVLAVQMSAVVLAKAEVLPLRWLALPQPVLFFALAGALFRPYGTNLSAVGAAGVPVPKMHAGIRAWGWMPVQPERVLRGVFIHGLVAGLLLWAFVQGLFLVMSTVFGTDPVVEVVSYGLIAGVPCVASMQTALAVGDRRRTFAAFILGIGTLFLAGYGGAAGYTPWVLLSLVAVGLAGIWVGLSLLRRRIYYP